MSGRSKIVYCGEWVWVRPFFNENFKTNGHCRLCKGLSCAPGWFSIETSEFRCRKCFDAEAEHWRTA